MTAILTYFPIRGRAEVIRLILEEKGIAYQSDNIALEEWKTRRKQMPFKVVPVFQEGDVQIAESQAIVRHLARKYQLYGRDEEEATRCDILSEAIRDGMFELGTLFWDEDFASKRDAFVSKDLKHTLKNLEAYLNSYAHAKEYCVGDALTFADFTLWNYLDWVRALAPETLQSYPTLCALKSATENRPRIQAYLKSERRPPTITVSMAYYGTTPETS